MAVTKIVVNGKFSPREVLEILQKVRDIEQVRPEELHVNIFVDSPDMSKETVKEIFSKVVPPLPYTWES